MSGASMVEYFAWSLVNPFGVIVLVALLGTMLTNWDEFGLKGTLTCVGLWSGALLLCYLLALPPAAFFAVEAILVIGIYLTAKVKTAAI